MKIALVGLTHPFRGGIAHYTTLLCQALQHRHEVRFFALRRQYPTFLFPGTTQKDASQRPVTVPHEACVDSINPLTWLSTCGKIRRFTPDFILFSWWQPFFAPAFGTIAHLAKWLHIPSCYLCHNILPHECSRLDRVLLTYAFSAAQCFITHSQADLDHCKRLRPGADIRYNPHPTYRIFAANAVPTMEQAKAQLHLTDKKVLLHFGFIRPYKGLTYLLEAMARLSPEEGFHLLIVGEFYEAKQVYLQALKQLQDRQQLTLIDRYVPNEDVPLYFSAADLVVAPYLAASQSGVIQMAYAFSKPVIATHVGGLSEVVADHRTGYLLPPGDAPAIARAVRQYFEPGVGETFRANIRREQDRYAWNHMVSTIEAVGETLRARRRPTMTGRLV